VNIWNGELMSYHAKVQLVSTLLAINPEYLTYPFAFTVDETWYNMPSSTFFLRLDERERASNPENFTDQDAIHKASALKVGCL
jgi:hypothetical protein